MTFLAVLRSMHPLVLLALAAGLASPAWAQRTIVLVRHAELLSGQMASPADTPLSPQGEERARRLASTLAAAGVTAVYTTDFARTRLTAAPLAELKQITPTVVAKQESASLPARIGKEHPDGVVLVVGHSDTLPALIRSITGGEEAKIESADHGSIFIVTPVSDGRATLLRLRY